MIISSSCTQSQAGNVTDAHGQCTESIVIVIWESITETSVAQTELITTDQLIIEQTNDRYVQQIVKSIDQQHSELLWNDDGLFCWMPKLDGSHQIVATKSLREQGLYCEYDGPLTGPPVADVCKTYYADLTTGNLWKITSLTMYVAANNARKSMAQRIRGNVTFGN